MDKYIDIDGARVNNLKNISVKIPRDKLVVITGISGSGKSSLAFETLFAEGQRRFAESLSSFARQFLGRMGKPQVDKIEGIPPAIAIEQRVNSKNPRSTVGTITEVYDYLRLIYSKIGRTYSPVSGKEVKRENVQDVVNYICSLYNNTVTSKRIVYVISPINWADKDKRVENLINLRDEGFSRFLNCNSMEIIKINDLFKDISKYESADIALLIDRFAILSTNNAKVSQEEITRMQDSVQTAFLQGKGALKVIYKKEDSTFDVRIFSNVFEADGIVFDEPNELMFSYNNPIGACPVCGGYGNIIGIDESLVVPNQSLSVYEGAIACWRGEVMGEYQNKLILNSSKFNFPIHRPYLLLSKEEKKLLWDGNLYFTGINDFFKIVESQRYKIQYKYLLSRYSGKTVCPECEGSRLKKETNYVKIAGLTITEMMNMPISALFTFFEQIALSDYESKIANRAIKEIRERLMNIIDVGLGYLTLNRRANSLSGGESQRINLVGSIGNALVGSLYILDEPSIGLHPRDTQKLIGVLKKLRDLGNTVVIVEHDMEIIRNADYLIDIGPLAGVHGGEVMYQGTISKALGNTSGNTRSLTITYLNGIKKIEHAECRRGWHNFIELRGCMEHNLKDINVKIPLGIFTVVTGVSGSGKSTLISDLLYPALERHFDIVGPKPGAFREMSGDLNLLNGVEFVDQNPIGKSSRSNPVTYLKIYDDIRKLFADQPYAKMNGYGNSHFSFNIDGGRCPQCLGDGFITVPMQFMADVTMVCDECGGKRFKSDILEVKYNNKNISDILDMSVEEAIDFFKGKKESISKRIAHRLEVLREVGLDYVKLGQSSSTLSGGESQRIKLAQFLSKEDNNSNTLFIFDEPTTGLHLHDIHKLIKAFNALIAKGHTVVVVEHNVDVIDSADWVIDLGPEGGLDGGNVVFTGTPDELKKVNGNYTGEALSNLL